MTVTYLGVHGERADLVSVVEVLYCGRFALRCGRVDEIFGGCGEWLVPSLVESRLSASAGSRHLHICGVAKEARRLTATVSCKFYCCQVMLLYRACRDRLVVSCPCARIKKLATRRRSKQLPRYFVLA